MTNPRDCEHGHLARSCESCAWDRDREELRTLLRQALDALEDFDYDKRMAAIAAIKEALK